MRLCTRENRLRPGMRFGKLETLGEPFLLRAIRNSSRQPLQWISFIVCRCECGVITVACCSSLRSANTRSCGCQRAVTINKLSRFHGLSTGPLKRVYSIWKGMRSRCFDDRNGSWHAYGKRGITICDEWLDPRVFAKWATENGYREGLVLDRIDNDGNYEPSNCQWLTSLENVRKQRRDVVEKIAGLEAEVVRLKRENAMLRQTAPEGAPA